MNAMTATEALVSMKTECAVLAEALTDVQLLYFLRKHSKATETVGTNLYNMNKAIYEALGSALTVLPMSFSRGGVAYTRADLQKTLKEYQRKAVAGNSDFQGVGIGVVIRDISS